MVEHTKTVQPFSESLKKMPKKAQSSIKIPLTVKQCEPIPFRYTKARSFYLNMTVKDLRQKNPIIPACEEF